MKKEIIPLNEKREPVLANRKGKSFVYGYSYPEKDVKETLKNLKEEIKGIVSALWFHEEVDKAFEKHIGSQGGMTQEVPK